jgi:hypothetical protein
VIEADLEREYGRDLCDLWRGTMTLRKVGVLIKGLPPGSASMRAIAGVTGPLSTWSLTEALLARLVDETAAYRWQWESAHLEPNTQHRDPPTSVLPREEQATKGSEVAHRDDIPIVSPHELGGFVYGEE